MIGVRFVVAHGVWIRIRLSEERGDGAARAVEESLAGGEIFLERLFRQHEVAADTA